MQSLMILIYWVCWIVRRIYKSMKRLANRAGEEEETRTTEDDPSVPSTSFLLVPTQQERLSKGTYDYLPVMHVKEKDSDKICVVCFEHLWLCVSTRLSCAHEFHRRCVIAWLSTAKEPRCPLCNMPT